MSRRRQQPRHSPQPARGPAADHGTAQDQPFIREVRTAMREPESLALLALASGIVEAARPRHRHPLEAAETGPSVSLGDLVELLVGTPIADTTALLTVVAHLTDDAGLASLIRAARAQRRHPVPVWLRGLAQAQIESVPCLGDDLGDADDYVLTISLPGSGPLSLVVLVDHHLDRAVKDAFAVPLTGQDLVIDLRGELSAGLTVTRPEPATVRALFERGIEVGETYLPPLESESWPQCRPLLEWALRLLPGGASVAEQRAWIDQERHALCEAVLASPEGAELHRSAGEDAADLEATLVDVTLDRSTGDPLRWSGKGTEAALAWASTKVADVELRRRSAASSRWPRGSIRRSSDGGPPSIEAPRPRRGCSAGRTVCWRPTAPVPGPRCRSSRSGSA